MFTRVSKKMANFCWSSCYSNRSIEDEMRECEGKVRGLMWYKSIGEHLYGEFSMAAVQANGVIEDQCQLESGPLSSLTGSGPYGTFVGIYDGHGGPQAAYFVNTNLFYNLTGFASQHEEISGEVIKKAFLATDEEFMTMARKQWDQKPHIAYQGTCCLVGIICNGQLFTANAGDSRAVLGRIDTASRTLKAMQLSTDHNAKMLNERDELQELHPHDPDIIVQKHKAWRVKGIIQVTRSLGDVYLKSPEFNKEPLPQKYRVPEPFTKPILRAEPTISVLKLLPEDQFIIFGSDGLWEHLTNQEAVDIVNNNSRHGIAKSLVKAALRQAAKKREMRYSDLEKIEAGVRRHFHDDITVIVIFLDKSHVDKASYLSAPYSIKGGGGLPNGF
ncbi:hypothetical protein Cgig2_004534 [Carnegiea gigantea]|uniref:protein-serine/threonine phosphatase n=1 Tax=Carnegiea gigantea TaxID=171969 RepID=A0A9Q1K7Q0_9CARY|nr:hypothetical protein Cgig2_004534 [Carnegiea gigantea]